MSGSYLFLRDDDVARDTAGFRAFRQMTLERRLPVVYAVIPKLLSRRMVQRLIRDKQEHGNLCDIVQHGYGHVDHSRPGEDKYEFGPARHRAVQLKDICAGQQLMDRAFGPLWTRAFVPPYHGYDQNTREAARKAGFRIFSAGWDRLSVRGSLMNCPVSGSLNIFDARGREICLNSGEMEQILRRAVRVGQITGLVFHHDALRTARDRQQMECFLDGLVKGRDLGRYGLILFSQLLRSVRQSPE